MASLFITQDPQLEDYWRGIILFGRNVASYKFALAKTLLELQPQAGQLLKTSDLAPIFAKHLADHVKRCDKQSTSSSSKFLDGIRGFNAGTVTEAQLQELTVRYGFQNVIDAFHVVGQGPIARQFYIDERKHNQGIRITDEFSQLLQSAQALNLPDEVESRWNLVEAAWELNVSRNVVAVSYDEGAQQLFAQDKQHRRKPVTSVRGALSGYQKGKCFYCFADICLKHAGHASFPDVDHFLPHVLKAQLGSGAVLDGVWNLVLACRECNRGAGGKFAAVPKLNLLQRLHRRNEFFITSHHPLRETIMLQTGSSEQQRIQFLRDIYQHAINTLLQQWEPPLRGPAVF